MNCGVTKVMKQSVGEVDCASVMCTTEDDVDTCCEDRQPCSQFNCPSPGSTILDGSVLCTGALCSSTTEESKCCVDLGQCSTYTCVGANNVKMAGAPTYCAGSTCNEAECCATKELCSAAGLECGNGKDLKVDAGTIFCTGEFCVENDLVACCEDKELCAAGMTSGDGKTYCSSFACDAMIQDAASTECEDSGCTQELCCVQAYGPPISDTVDTPFTQDTFVSGFKLNECSYTQLTANPTLVASLKDNICAEFASTTGTDAAWCSIEFSAGSVNVKVTIEAPVGQTLPAASAMKTPETTQILSAVTATPGIEATTQGGKPIGVSEVKAVLFKEGQTTAAAVPPPTPPSPPPTPTADDKDDKDEEDGAIGLSAATSLTVAAAMLNLFA